MPMCFETMALVMGQLLAWCHVWVFLTLHKRLKTVTMSRLGADRCLCLHHEQCSTANVLIPHLPIISCVCYMNITLTRRHNQRQWHLSDVAQAGNNRF